MKMLILFHLEVHCVMEDKYFILLFIKIVIYY